MKGDVVKPDPNWEEDEIFYCSICDLEVCLFQKIGTSLDCFVCLFIHKLSLWMFGVISGSITALGKGTTTLSYF